MASRINISIDELTSIKAHTDEDGEIKNFDNFIECQSHFSNDILSQSELDEIDKFYKESIKEDKQ
tara:strand:+ start:750 stop:944 length:195 start_codon:yes stop_codon:yes gene_type:complete